MIGSAQDKKAALIEVSPNNFGVYEVQNSNQLICTNHFQGDAYKSDERNQMQILESHSKYRFDRMQELLVEKDKMNPNKMVEILRNREGLHEQKIGYGNEKCLNQLLAHHGIVFKPESRLVWVSSNPYQMGEFVAFDLNKIFSKKENDFVVLETDSLNIPKDPFLDTDDYNDYVQYRIQDKIIDNAIEGKKDVDASFIKNYQNLNPNNWIVYYKAGKYFYEKKQYKEAKIEFQKALTQEIATVPDKIQIEKYLKKINKKIR